MALSESCRDRPDLETTNILAPRVNISSILPRVTLPAASVAERAEGRIGTTIREKYRIDRVLGVGGMATVYLATHRNGSRGALKILHPELAVHELHRERFVREAYVANSIEHAGAVRVVDDDVAEDNCPFFVMELLEGETLEARRRRMGRLDVREVLVIAHALCDTLTSAHDHGVVHRDIKPENLFLTRSGTLKVLDFGIARVRHEGGALGTRTGMMMGTPAFMPPEQALGRRAEIDERTDLWAAGATMFTLLSGRLVREADSPEEMMVRAATQPVRPLQEVLPDIPDPVAAVVDKALSFKRDDRFLNAHAMRDAIAQAHVDAFGDGIETTAMPLGPQSLSPSSLRLAPSHAADVVTLPADGAGEEAASATVVDTHPPTEPSTAGEGAAAGQHPTVPAQGDITIAERALRTRESGESVPASNRSRTYPKRVTMALFGAAVALFSVFVGARHVIGRPPETIEVPAHCKQKSDCPADQHCAEGGRCVSASGCVSNAACVADNGGKPAICRKDVGRCVLLETDRCRVLSEKADLENDDTLWVGAMYPERDESMTYGAEAMRCVELARRDFARLTGGLPPVKPGDRPRPLAVVACDDTQDFERIADHLVNDVGVPAILGFGRSKEVLDLASRHFIPKGILALASNTASMLSSIPHETDQPRMVFRVTTHAEGTAQVKAAIVREVIEPELRGPSGLLGAAGTLKIAFLRSENASGTSHTDAMVTALEKRRVATGSAHEELRPFIFEDSMARKLSLNDERSVQDVVAYAPHVILDAGAPHRVFVAVEQQWPARLPHRPRYLVSDSLVNGPMRSLALAHQTSSSRLFGVNPSTESTAVRKFVVHYNGAFQDKLTVASATSAPYDAFYVLAYAAVSLGQTPITGTNLARAVKRLLPPGEPIDVGPSGIFPAFKELSAGRNIDLGGAQTSLDFDLETGDAACDYETYCFDRTTKQSVLSNLFYRARLGRLEGTWKCP